MEPSLDNRKAWSEALLTLDEYVRDALTLEALVHWAERLESSNPEDARLRRLAADFANPLLCREQALALAYEYLRAERASRG